jgi:hypothetical protein
MRGVTQALGGGIRRVLSAPALLAAVTAVSLLYPIHPNAASRRTLVEYAVVVSFLAGGVLDRYARARPTRAFGFFGACGRHVAAMLRLAAIETGMYVAADNVPDVRAALALALLVALVGVYARVRLVVEDRRSALGAILASVRFIRRHAAGAITIFVVWTALVVAAGLAARAAAPILILPLVASATIFFQSRLAHSGYAAAPPIQWPESPAAEAIANPR